MAAKDYTGQKFWNYTAIKATDLRGANKSVLWLFRCACGNERTMQISDVRRGIRKSCGCVKAQRTHGKSSSKEYAVWASMHYRCTNPNCENYSRYGGRGISICERWQSFENFLEDMGPKPAGHSIDRIDNDGNYEPANCRWASDEQQRGNKGNSQHLTYNGKTMTIGQWAKQLGVKKGRLFYRLYSGWPTEEIILGRQKM